jgi:hypothetical protein
MNAYQKIIDLHLNFAKDNPTQTLFWPSCSIHEANFSADQIHHALKYFLDSNPFFTDYQLVEKRCESPQAIHELGLQDWLEDDFDSYSESFRIVRVRFDSDAGFTAMVCFFPFSTMDGFTAFKFHQALANTILTGNDHFQTRDAVRGIDLDVESLPRVSAAKFSADAQQGCGRPRYSFQKHDSLNNKRLHGLIFDDGAKDRAKSIAQLKNLAYDKKMTCGNYLLYARVPVEEYDLEDINDRLRSSFDEQRVKLANCTDSAGLRDMYLGIRDGLFGCYMINNYGDCSALAAPTLRDYRWAMPVQFNPLKSGVVLAISLAQQAQTLFIY